MEIITVLIVGLIVGLLARFFLPGRQNVGLLMTIALGVVGALIGNAIGEAISPDGPGAMHWILAVVVSMGILMLFGALTGGRRRVI